MNIAWQYLDKRAATVSALKDYESMKHIAAHAPEEIISAKERLTGVGGSGLRDMPRGPFDPHAGEDRIVRTIDAIDALETKYHQAVAFMAWFHTGWDALNDAERFVLRCFYMAPAQRQSDSVDDICEAFHIERTAAYKRKDRALARLALMLYGR